MKKVFLLLIACCLLLIAPVVVYAQGVSLGTGIPVSIPDEDVQDGDIISSREGGSFTRTTSSYDPFIFGVITLEPALYLYDKNSTTDYPAVNTGKVFVRVSTANGSIERGDPITSSDNPGVGVKASDNGFILGYAEEGYNTSDPNQVGKILVSISPHYAQFDSNIFGSLTSLPKLSYSASPLNLIRYLLAGLVGIASFYIGFRFFGRASLEGIQAMGRNPLARAAIIAMVVINSGLTVGVMLIGLFVAYLILVI